MCLALSRRQSLRLFVLLCSCIEMGFYDRIGYLLKDREPFTIALGGRWLAVGYFCWVGLKAYRALTHRRISGTAKS